MAQRRIGVFGGTFNPVHLGHLVMAQDAQESFALDEVLWMPAGQPPHKLGAETVSGEHRLAMIERALQDHPTFRISDLELRRGGVSFTVDTMRQLQMEQPGVDWHFIIGADTLLELSTWREIGALLGLCRFVTIARPGAGLDRQQPERLGLPLDAARRLLEDVVTGHLIGISSSEIRQRIRQGKSIRYLVPPGVADYIARRNLYQSEESPSKR